MSTFVSTPQEAFESVKRFQAEVDKSADLQQRLPFARAWYAIRTDDGWIFGPSKFIGYRDLTADEYVQDSQELDGRKTERQLAQWFVQVSPSDALYQELSHALSEFLSSYGKAPSSLIRINVAHEQTADENARDRAIADLMIAVARHISAAERSRLRAAL